MNYNDFSSVTFVKDCKLRVETFPRKKIAQFKVCKKCKKSCKRKTFHVHCMKKLANDKTWKGMAKLMKVFALW